MPSSALSETMILRRLEGLDGYDSSSGRKPTHDGRIVQYLPALKGKTGIGPFHRRIHPGEHYHEVLHDRAPQGNVCVVYLPCVQCIIILQSFKPDPISPSISPDMVVSCQ